MIQNEIESMIVYIVIIIVILWQLYFFRIIKDLNESTRRIVGSGTFVDILLFRKDITRDQRAEVSRLFRKSMMRYILASIIAIFLIASIIVLKSLLAHAV